MACLPERPSDAGSEGSLKINSKLWQLVKAFFVADIYLNTQKICYDLAFIKTK